MTDLVLGIITALIGGALAVAGAAMVAFGGYGFVVGFHGGWISSLLTVLFGAALGFVGYYCGRYGLRQVQEFNEKSRRSAQR